MTEVTLKKVKTFEGMDGVGFNADVYVDGKKAAIAIDEGCGGSMILRFHDWKESKVEIERTNVKFLGEGKTELVKVKDRVTPLEAKLYQHCIDTLDMSDEMNWFEPEHAVIGRLVDEHVERKRLKGQLSRRVLAVLDKEGNGDRGVYAWSIKKGHTKEQVIGALKRRHDDKITILNEMPFDEAYKLVLEVEGAGELE